MPDTTAASTASTTAAATGTAGAQTGTESVLSNWAGPYVTNMLGQAQALGNQPYPGYSAPLTAGSSGLQNQAFTGLAGLTLPSSTQMQAFTPKTWTQQEAQTRMTPYLETTVDPQMEEARRQSLISGLADQAALTKAGAYGGGRGALMESERNRNLQANLSNIYGQGIKAAYDQALAQFNQEQQQQQAATSAAQNYGLQALDRKSTRLNSSHTDISRMPSSA